MDEVVHSYVEEIKASDEYLDYIYERERVKQYPELKAQIDAYRRRNFEIQTSPDTAYDVIERFENEYAQFRENPLVADFLAAELAFCRLMQMLSFKVTEELDFE